jgi:DNA-binding NarL/FixJ family response regulator
VALRCLIVDDNESFLDSASRLLESQGLQVIGCASSSDQAVRLVEELHPDVALVDVELGNEDGVEVARRLAERAPSTHVILISTHAEVDLVDVLADGPAVDFLPKSGLSAAAIAQLLR